MKAWKQIAILVVLIGECACGHEPPKPPPSLEVHTVTVRRSCLHDERKPEPRDFTAITDGVAPWAACYSAADAIALASYLRALERFADNAVTDCGSTSAPDAGAPPVGAP